MASLISNHQPTPSASYPAGTKRKKKSQPSSGEQQREREDHKRWKSEKQQQIYSTKLVRALRKLRIKPPASSQSTAPRGRAVREAADRALAVAARGRTLWSRAILTNRSVKLKFRKQKRPTSAPGTKMAAMAWSSRSRKSKVSVLRLKGKSLPAVERKVKVLGRLVPGCRKQPLTMILEEATDYIAALEMQVRTMTALAERLSGGSSSAPSPPSG